MFVTRLPKRSTWMTVPSASWSRITGAGRPRGRSGPVSARPMSAGGRPPARAAAAGRIGRFVPASGAATRMFKELLAWLARGGTTSRAALEAAAAGDDDARAVRAFVAGIELIKKGLGKPVGSLTQLGTIRLGTRTEKRTPLIRDIGDVLVADDVQETAVIAALGKIRDS